MYLDFSDFRLIIDVLWVFNKLITSNYHLPSSSYRKNIITPVVVMSLRQDPKTHVYMCGLKGMESGFAECFQDGIASLETSFGNYAFTSVSTLILYLYSVNIILLY